MKNILELRDISKSYSITRYVRSNPQPQFRDVIVSYFDLSAFNKKNKKINFWALKDISFNVAAGERIGIIGKNGAGKSTLLKILSRITFPTTGGIISRGRIASLLEVGTGFHNELTGKENIFFNGSILGMKNYEIKSKFDEIVDFSGIEQFINTPLKHYSTGMQLRLAFAVAAFLESEILIIDEVLAVGDTEFQKKCINKIKDVTQSGRTIIFVSHDLNAVQTICQTVIFLDEGTIKNIGPTGEIIAKYLHQKELNNFWEQNSIVEYPHYSYISINLKGEQPRLILEIECKITTNSQMVSAFVVFNISNKIGTTIGQAIPNEKPFIKLNANETLDLKVEVVLEGFIPDDYFLSAWIGSYHNQTYDWQKECLSFSITKSPQLGRVFPHSTNNGNLVFKSQLI